jgi:hypothetical protein
VLLVCATPALLLWFCINRYISGDPPDIDELFPPRPIPAKRGPLVSCLSPSHPHPQTQTHATIINPPTIANAQAEDSTSTTSTHTSNSNYTTSNSITSNTNSNGTSTSTMMMSTTTTAKPTTTGVGFFTPDHPSSALTPDVNRNGMGVGNLFHPLRHEMRSLRMGPRDSM